MSASRHLCGISSSALSPGDVGQYLPHPVTAAGRWKRVLSFLKQVGEDWRGDRGEQLLDFVPFLGHPCLQAAAVGEDSRVMSQWGLTG